MYQQQVRAGAKQKLWTCPRKQFLQDLSHKINEWTEAGEETILLTDMNDDILEKDILQFCQEMNLVEAIQSLHGPSPVPTHQQGRKAIDGIFLNKTSLSGTKGGFLAFGKVTISDH